MEINISELDIGTSCIYFINLGFVYALKGDFVTAEQMIRKAAPLVKDLKRLQVLYYMRIGQVYLLKNDYASAEDVLRKSLELSREFGLESNVGFIKMQLGATCFGLGKHDLARRYIDEASVVAKKNNGRRDVAECLRILAELECKEGNSKKAIEHFKKAMDMFAMLGYQYKLAVTRYLAGTSGLYRGGEKQALLYLAKEYFESEGITAYLEKIDAEIEQVLQVKSRAVDLKGRLPIIIAVNPEMKKIVEIAKNIAPSKMPVLLAGPTGTGKDLLAQYIHYCSGRRGRFVLINVAAMPNSMVEAELFGYKKGAYTGADDDKMGLIEEAEGGTLYLSEISDASPELQAKLLDVLESKKVRRLGETKEREVNFRIIAATNHDLGLHILEGKFRPDLYHRLCGIPLTIPPLSKRLDDIPLLLEYFLTACGVDCRGDDKRESFDRLVRLFSAGNWSGNVRQLKAEVERLCLMWKGDISLMVKSLTLEHTNSERDRLIELLNRENWNRREVARRLGVSESTIRRRIKKYNLLQNQSK